MTPSFPSPRFSVLREVAGRIAVAWIATLLPGRDDALVIVDADTVCIVGCPCVRHALVVAVVVPHATQPERALRARRRQRARDDHRSEEHTSELKSLQRISYAVFRLKKKKKH